MLRVSGAICRSRSVRPAAALAAATLLGTLSLLGCGKGDTANGKLLISDKMKVASTEFALARAHDFDRACEGLYLEVPARTQLLDATDETQNTFASVADDLEDTPMKVRRWDYVLKHDRQRPETYESIFIGEWGPARRHRASAAPEYALFAPVRCVVSQRTIKIFALEPPFAEAAGDGTSVSFATIVAKYSRIPPGVGESVEQRIRDFATSDKANVGGAAAISVIIKEGDASRPAPAVSGSSARN